MTLVVRVCLAVALVSAAACSRSPAAPDDNDPPGNNPPVTGHLVTGTTVDALTNAAAPAISLATNGTALGSSGADGTFRVGFAASGNNRLTLSGANFVERQTGIQAPSLDLRLSLIPSSFDLTAFNQMFRHAAAGLTRWTTRPRLVIERRVLQFSELNASMYTALTETLTDAEVASLRADLVEGLALLTDGKLAPFTSIDVRTSAPGAPIGLGDPGQIVVTRQVGLTTAENFWGYARWSTTADGTVTRGFIILDRDFERSSSAFHKSLRMHELGHALGCQHVDRARRASVMNSDARTEPNEFDRNAARLALLRPVGNRAPDIDPTGHTATTASRTAGRETWHGAH